MNIPSWIVPVVRVLAARPEALKDASRLAERLDLELTAGDADPSAPRTDWLLCVDGLRRTLVRPDGVALTLDFTSGKTAARQRESGRIRQPLARALGVARWRRRSGRVPRVVDATGGLGRDAWFAAALGCPVVLIERSPIVHALLESALARARADHTTADIAARIVLQQAEAIGALELLPPDDAEVIYLDPMYPDTRRKAAVTKGMQFLHALLGPDDDNADLLRSALASASRQVTVKRPSTAPPLSGDETFTGQRSCIESPGTRYDVYLTG